MTENDNTLKKELTELYRKLALLDVKFQDTRQYVYSLIKQIDENIIENVKMAEDKPKEIIHDNVIRAFMSDCEKTLTYENLMESLQKYGFVVHERPTVDCRAFFIERQGNVNEEGEYQDRWLFRFENSEYFRIMHTAYVYDDEGKNGVLATIGDVSIWNGATDGSVTYMLIPFNEVIEYKDPGYMLVINDGYGDKVIIINIDKEVELEDGEE